MIKKLTQAFMVGTYLISSAYAMEDLYDTNKSVRLMCPVGYSTGIISTLTAERHDVALFLFHIVLRKQEEGLAEFETHGLQELIREKECSSSPSDSHKRVNLLNIHLNTIKFETLKARENLMLECIQSDKFHIEDILAVPFPNDIPSDRINIYLKLIK